MTAPRISVVVVGYDMARELPRTLQSLAPGYQRGIDAADYEVIVVDNGSPAPIDAAAVRAHGPNFRCERAEPAAPSPVPAVNRAVRETRGEIVGLLLDGARLVTPGILAWAERAFRLHGDPTVATLSWHLGRRPQQDGVSSGYDAAAEDALLAEIGWPRDGYRLFEIASLAGSSVDGYFLPLAESNGLFLRRASFEALGGYDEAFDLPGGGLANVDLYKRAAERGAPLVVLLGEGTFHQVHGGISTNVPRAESDRLYRTWAAQYERLRGAPWERPRTPHAFLGEPAPAALPGIAASARVAAERHGHEGSS